jgi:hypothetical protein
MHANDTPPTRSGQDTRSGKATYHTGVKGAAPKAMMRLALGSAALQISKEESEFHGRRKEALANAEKRRELLATIAEQRGLAEQALTDLESRHKRSALKRFLGETKDTLRDEIAAARERCAELDDAAVQAGVEIELFEKDAAGFARLAEIVRGVLIARERKASHESPEDRQARPRAHPRPGPAASVGTSRRPHGARADHPRDPRV